jgi:hypothetical protein
MNILNIFSISLRYLISDSLRIISLFLKALLFDIVIVDFIGSQSYKKLKSI